jgi:hypothetical protein
LFRRDAEQLTATPLCFYVAQAPAAVERGTWGGETIGLVKTVTGGYDLPVFTVEASAFEDIRPK